MLFFLRNKFLLFLFFLTSLSAHAQPDDSRLNWWRDARFGMFIHWGLYAIPAGEWNGATNHAEWIRTTAQIPLATYDSFVQRFNPVKFDARQWVRLAKQAGMKYIVITTKHHDGFALYDSKVSDFDVMATPFGRDILKELAEACRLEGGIRLCFYHSIMDWHHPDYLPRRDWEKSRSAAGADFQRYINYMKSQLKELLTQYGNIGVLWFDGEWEGTWTHEMGASLYKYVRGLQPNIIVNNRVDKGREGMHGGTRKGGFTGDFGTPEQEIPATGIPGADWESCMTMNGNWGFNSHDQDWKSTRDLLEKLVDIASKGGNFLLNVGPTAEGLFPAPSVERLKGMGNWMRVNGEAIYGTKASPYSRLDWGRCTQKAVKNNTRLYFHIFNPKAGDQVTVPGLANRILKSYWLGNKKALAVKKNGDGYAVQLPAQVTDDLPLVFVMETEGSPIVYKEPVIEAESQIFTDQLRVDFKTDIPGAVVRVTTDGSEPDGRSAIAGFMVLKNSCTVKARCFIGSRPISASASARFSKQPPAPGLELVTAAPGLNYAVYEGKWDKLPDFTRLRPVKTGVCPQVSLMERKETEEYGYTFDAWLDVPETGIYQFFLSSDDGSRLIIGGMTLDNDGLHGMKERTAELALGKGLHRVHIEFFENSGGDELELKWKRPGMRSAENIPPSAWRLN